MCQFVDQRGEQFLTHRAMHPCGALPGGGAVSQRRQQASIQLDQVAAGTPVSLLRQVLAPAHADLAIQLLQHARRQGSQGFVKQKLGGGAFSR